MAGRCRLGAWLIVLLISTSARLALAQDALEGQVATVQTHVSGYPEGQSPRFDRLRLGSSDRLIVSFDLLGSAAPILTYRLVHCDASWRPSPLQAVEYVAGFSSYDLPMPEPSRSTLQPYVHYSLAIPNEQTQLRRSGNYLLEIGHAGHESAPLVRIPFAVSEESLGLTAEVSPSTIYEVRGRYQQVDVTLIGTEQIARPEDELAVVVLQNGRWDNARTLTKPSEQTASRLRYAQAQGATFEAGNEYHKLEHLTERGIGMGVERVELDRGLDRLSLYPVANRSEDSYSYEDDHNGLQVIRSLQTDHPATEADYHRVRFAFSSPRLSAGDVVLEGEAVAHLPLEARTLGYDDERRCYELELLLKMGYQEFLFLYRPHGSSALSSAPTEGDHYQTSNGYTVLVYRRAPADRADRLVATLDINTPQ